MDAEKMTKRLDEWMVEHVEDWYTVCGQGRYPLTEKEYMALDQELRDQGLQPLTRVLMTCHGYAVYDRLLDNIAGFLQISREEALEKLRMIKRGIPPCS